MAHRLYILSSGPGGTAYLTTEALAVLEEAEVVIGYRNYIKEIMPLLEGKEVRMSGMVKEYDRCLDAMQTAQNGRTTCLVANGDVNLFGIATRTFEIIEEMELWDTLEVIPVAGVTALLATAARIGAPIGQDMALLSLSDKMTDVELIDKRVKAALETDMILCIYSPKTKKHTFPYLNLLEALQDYSSRIAVIASHVGQKKERITVTDTDALIKAGLEHPQISMSTLLVIGNSQTHLTPNGKVFTPRPRKQKRLKGDR